MITINKYAYHVDWDAEGRGINRPISGGSIAFDFMSYLANYYTKLELQTSGQSSVNFDNITDAYHNNLLDLQGGLTTSSGDSSGKDAEYYHLDLSTYLDITGISFAQSISKDSVNQVTLVNDLESPGNSKYYGTDSGGTKGWFDLTTSAQPFQTAAFANPLNIDCTTYKDWICTVTGDCTVDILNASDGDAGMLELIIDGSGVDITLGTSFTKKLGLVNLNDSDGEDNIISWRAVGDGSAQEIIYTIGQIEV